MSRSNPHKWMFYFWLPFQACNSSYMQYYFKWFFVFHSSEVICSFLIKKAKSDRNRNCIFSFLWESQGTHIGSFLLCFTYLSWLPLQTDTYINDLVEIFLKLSMKTVQVHLIIWTTLVCCYADFVTMATVINSCNYVTWRSVKLKFIIWFLLLILSHILILKITWLTTVKLFALLSFYPTNLVLKQKLE